MRGQSFEYYGCGVEGLGEVRDLGRGLQFEDLGFRHEAELE